MRLSWKEVYDFEASVIKLNDPGGCAYVHSSL